MPDWAAVGASAAAIGEICFEDERQGQCDLLVKYLFTSERLSVQVHPDDAQARARGYRCGKDEAWYVLDAEPGAVIGLGPIRPVSREALRSAALDGSIESLIDWKPAAAGDSYYSPAGTVHAIGGGVLLVEIQQNLDLTYRLYDYGRPRELHLDEALAVACREPWQAVSQPADLGDGRRLLAHGRAFVLEHWKMTGSAMLSAGDSEILAIPLAAGGHADGTALDPGTVWRVESDSALRLEPGAEWLVAYPGSDPRENLFAAGISFRAASATSTVREKRAW